MSLTLFLTALTMGVVGGPHCVLMCGAACAGLAKGNTGQPNRAMAVFLAGRLLGYSVLGAAVAFSMQSLAWLTTQTVVLRPVWTLLHVGAMAVGLVLLVQGRQPAWLERRAKRVWYSTGQFIQKRGLNGSFLLGGAWALMPCGLLYSAVMVAALTDGVASGALFMALFAVGSSLSLLAGPWLLLRLAQLRHSEIGVRLAGLALVLMAGAALWMGFVHQQAPWCRP